VEKVTRGALVRRDVTRWLSAMVSLIEHSDRSVRRYQRRFEDGGLAALGQSALNCRWRRPTLQWRTAHEMWAAGLQSTMIATSYTTKSSTAPRAFVCTEWRRTWNWTHAT